MLDNDDQGKVKKLNEEFEKGITSAHSINCEKRTNVSLYLGNHHLKARNEIDRNLQRQGVEKSSRVRLTRNHIFKICEYMTNAILSAGGSPGIFPANESELQDQKAAELHSAVFNKWKRDCKYKELERKLAQDFVIDGEMVTKRYWDPNKGEIIGKEAVIDPETGMPEMDENGQVKTKPIKAGEAIVERIYGWDLILPPNIKELSQAPWVGCQKMMPTKELKEKVPEEIREKIIDESDTTFQVFEPTTGGYTDTKGMTLLREKYTKPCEKHPFGYFEIFNKDIVIFEGELPEGHPFPIKVGGFTDIPASPRHASIVRQLRPLQVQVNFAASQEALAQMTMGHDKLVMLGGASLQYKGSQRGVEKFITNSLQSPTILPGRSGQQFVDSGLRAVNTMYEIANVPEQNEDKANQMDPQTALFRSIKDKKRFGIYSEKFFEYMQELCEDVLALKKIHMSEDEVIRSVGSVERVNVSEFKNALPIGYQIAVEEVDEDASKMLGKHITLTNMLQYGGQGMGPEMVALIGRNMPFLNKEEIFSEQLVDYDTCKNIILALDRGEQVPVQPFDNADYLLPKLTTRMRKADFRFLDPAIQQNYQGFIQQLQQVKAQQLKDLKIQQAQLIPTTGGMVPLPIYKEVPTASGEGTKFERVKVPQDALEDLVAKLTQQGMVTDPMARLEQANQAYIAEMANEAQPQQPQIKQQY